MLLSTLLLLLGGVGVTFIITHSTIIRPLRELLSGTYIGTLISCPQCTGFWVGLFFALLSTPILSLTYYTLSIMLTGGAISFLSMFVNYVYSLMDAIYDYYDVKRDYYISKVNNYLKENPENEKKSDN